MQGQGSARLCASKHNSGGKASRGLRPSQHNVPSHTFEHSKLLPFCKGSKLHSRKIVHGRCGDLGFYTVLGFPQGGRQSGCGQKPLVPSSMYAA